MTAKRRITWSGTDSASYLSDVALHLVGAGHVTMPRFRVTHLPEDDCFELADRATWDKTYHGSLSAAQRAAEGILKEESSDG